MGEEVGSADLRLYIFHGDTDNGAGLSGSQQFLGVLQIEGVAIGFGDDFPGFGVKIGIHSLGAILGINGVQIQGSGHIAQNGIVDLHFKGVEAVSVQNSVIKSIHIQILAGAAGIQHQGLAGGIGIELIRGEGGLFTLELIGGFGINAVEAGAVFLHSPADVVGIQLHIGQQGDVIGAGHGLLAGFFPLCPAAGAAVIVGGLGSSSHIQLGAGLGGGQGDGFAGEADDHVLAGIGVLGGSPENLLCLLLGHTAQIYTGDGDIVQNQTIIGGSGQQDGNSGDNAAQDEKCGAAQADQSDFFVLFHLGAGFFRLFDDFLVKLGFRSFRSRLLDGKLLGCCKNGVFGNMKQGRGFGSDLGDGLLGGDGFFRRHDISREILQQEFLSQGVGQLREKLLRSLGRRVPTEAGLRKFTFRHIHLLFERGVSYLRLYCITNFWKNNDDPVNISILKNWCIPSASAQRSCIASNCPHRMPA